MKKYYFYASFAVSIILSLSRPDLFADEIILKDGSIVKGKIIQVTPKTIEFDPEGARPFDLLPRDQVTKIVYDDGSIINIQPPAVFNNITAEAEKESQDKPVESNQPNYQQEKTGNLRFLGPEWGWNNYVGLGCRYEFSVSDNFSLNLGLGIGSWGYRLAGGLRYYLDSYPFSSAIGLGAAFSTGLGKQEQDAELTDEFGNTTKEKIEINKKPITVMNISYLYNWQIFNDYKIYLEVGYAFRFRKAEDNYEIKDPDDANRIIILSDEEKDMMDIMQPGGLMIAVGIAF